MTEDIDSNDDTLYKNTPRYMGWNTQVTDTNTQQVGVGDKLTGGVDNTCKIAVGGEVSASATWNQSQGVSYQLVK